MEIYFLFHRKNSIEDMESCISNNKVKNLEYEAFILNERCHYTGAFCNSLHCDEMIHLCKMPYQLSKVSENANNFEEVYKRLKSYYKEHEDNDNEEFYILGRTGCGLCFIKRLQKSGVTHLKVVGRGNSIKNMEKDVQNLKKAIGMLNDTEDSDSYEKQVKDKLLHGECSGECYYQIK